MSDKVQYLAYGSNLHPMRLAARVPSARVIGVVELPGCMLKFHKRSHDDSGKCLLDKAAGSQHMAYGVLYEFDAHEKGALDIAEGRGNGYMDHRVQVRLNGSTHAPFVYEAQSTHIDLKLLPYHWYKHLVVAGARYHGLPADYIASIEAVPSKSDPNLQRAQDNADLLRRMGWV